MNYSSRFYLYAPLALLLLVGVAAGAHWWFAAAAMGKRLDAMNGREAMPGVTFGYRTRTLSGFPFRVDVVFDDVHVAVATPHGPLTWRAEHFALHALTYGRDETIFEAAGKQVLSWHDLKGAAHALPFEAGLLRASAFQNAGGLSRFDLDLVGLASPALTAARLQFHIRHNGQTSRLDVVASLSDAHLSPVLRGAFGGDLKTLQVAGSLAPAAPFDALRAGDSDWLHAVEACRVGGVFHIDTAEFQFGKLDLMGHGELALDDAHRPRGLLDFKSTGLSDWLAHTPSGESVLAAALQARAAKAGSDPAGRMGAALFLKDGILYLGDQPAGIVGPLY